MPALALADGMPVPDSGATDDTGRTVLPLLGGYRAEADPCKRVGEDDFTNQFLDDAADLVACPAGMENMGVFVTETGAVQVAENAGYVRFSVPVR